jgi:uncharacterized protein YbjT (DUF2867 family)
VTTVLVTGGTGHLGRELVPRLAARGMDVRILSRQARPDVPAGVAAVRGDLSSGEGVAEAVRGADVIAHLASDTGTLATISSRRGAKTEVEPTRRLLEAAKRDGSPHVVYISIVGIDTIPFAYYRTKLATERVVENSGLPYTILRTTQWHTLAWDFGNRLTKAPLVIAPKDVSMQLLDPGEVASRMITLIETKPAGRAPDMGGPEVIAMEDVLRDYLRTNGKRRAVRTIRLPGKMMEAMRRGDNLAPDHADGRITWPQWLASRLT